MTSARPVGPDQLYRRCDQNRLVSIPTQETPSEYLIGQERAESSLAFGFGIDSKGYNIFLVGPRGTGKASIIQSLVNQAAALKAVPEDWCLVHNFADPVKPCAFLFPPGGAQKFKKQMEHVLKSLRDTVPRILESKEFDAQKMAIAETLQERETELVQELDQKAQEQGFAIRKTQAAFLTVPIMNQKPLTQEEFAKLPENIQHDFKERKEKLEESIRETFRQLRKFERVAQQKTLELEKTTISQWLDRYLDEMQEEYVNRPEILRYFEQVMLDVADHLDDFKPKPEGLPGFVVPTRSFSRYEVNVLVDNSQLKGAPVMIELNPTYTNLFGKLERKALLGGLVTDFTMIEAGSYIRANGGYLVVQAKDVLRSPHAWEGLKRAILNGKVQIEDVAQELAVIPTAAIRPEPIPANVKVIMLGDAQIYALLHALDEDFAEMFKVKADFDSEMDRTEKNEILYAQFVQQLTHAEQLLPFDSSATAAVVEYGSRAVENQEKLTSQFSLVSDLIRESHYWAKQSQKTQVTSREVWKAQEQKVYRSDLISQKFQEWLEKGDLLVNTEGSAIGQVNGLAVYHLGDFVFGKPARITANTFAGRSGVVNIEREAKLSGRTHDKGLLILSGYLSGKFASDKVLCLGATVCFEQSYEEIDGDSASTAELVALLSSLAEVPIDQGIAITGSVNQKGELQPIGGVNYKIEGFFELCRKRGLNGKQGVLIPRQNVKNLMLKPSVVDAVTHGLFQIYAAENVLEAVEILSGVPATGGPESVMSRADQKLKQYSEIVSKDNKRWDA